MLDARFSHLYFYRSLHTPQHGLSAIADLHLYLLVYVVDLGTVERQRLGCLVSASAVPLRPASFVAIIIIIVIIIIIITISGIYIALITNVRYYKLNDIGTFKDVSSHS